MKNKNKGLLESVLFEQENVIPPSQTDPVEIPKDISLDMKVDRYLMNYEKNSIPTSQDYQIPGMGDMQQAQPGATAPVADSPKTTRIGEAKKVTLSTLLFEAPGDPPTGMEDAPQEDPTATPADGLDDVEVPGAGSEEAPVIDTPKINLESYAMGVARLIENYEALLNPKETILNRAIEYVKVNYDEATSKMLEEMLSQNFNVKRQETEDEFDKSNVPYATGALVAS